MEKDTKQLFCLLGSYLAVVTSFFIVAKLIGERRARAFELRDNKIEWRAFVEEIVQHPPPNSSFYTIKHSPSHPTNETRQLYSTEASPCTFIADVSQDQPMWMEFSIARCYVHIHSFDEIKTRPRTDEEERRLRFQPKPKKHIINPFFPSNLQF